MLNYYFFKTMISTLMIYLTGAIGCSVAMKAGDMNLGGEGQIYSGAFICAILLNKIAPLPSFFALPLCFLLSGLFTSLITLASNFLQEKKGINFLLSSFIISSALIPIIDSLISGPLRTTEGTLLATQFILQKYRYSPYINLVLAILLCVAFYFWLKKTDTGKKLCIYGNAREFSLYMGINKTRITITSAFLTGFFHGLCGAMAVCSTYYTCHLGFYTGMGWNALAVAMIAKAKPLLLIPAAIFMSFIITFSEQLALFSSFNFDIGMLIQSLIIFVTAIPIVKNFKWRNK